MSTTNAGGIKAYLRDIQRYPLMSHEETLKLFREMRETTDAERRQQIRVKLVNSNLRLVVSIAMKYKNQGVDIVDLIQEGSCGLMEGVKRFDPDMGYRLSTYASHWIKQAIRRHLTGTDQLAGARSVRLPSHVVAMLPRIRKVRMQLIDELGHEPDINLIAERVEATPDSVKAALGASGPVQSIEPYAQDGDRKGGMHRAAKFELAMQESTNYDPVKSDLEELVLSSQLHDIVRRSFSKLTPREEQVLRLRFGILEDPNSEEYKMSVAEEAQLRARINNQKGE